jgi:hypothetical protein
MMTMSENMQLPFDGKCYRLPRKLLYAGIICGLFFVSMGVTSVVVAWWNIDGSFRHPKESAIILGTIWFGSSLLAMWLVLACLFERLFLNSHRIIQHGIFRFRELNVSDVTEVQFRTRPAGGSVIVHSQFKTIKIDLGNFSPDERLEIASFFRKSISEDIQIDWDLFEESFQRVSATQRHTSRWATIVIVVVLMGFAGVFVFCWLKGLGMKYLYLGITNAIVLIWLLLATRKAPPKMSANRA